LIGKPQERAEFDSKFWSIVDRLDVCPPHRWSCPKLMKLQPERVAWTCERCGAITTSDDPALKPAA
jgi:hypothetical protein